MSDESNQSNRVPAIFGADQSSPEIHEIAKALASAQAAMEPALKDSRNPRFNSRYASLSQVIEASSDALGKHGLSILPKISWSGDKLSVRSLLLHSSGQWLDCGTLESQVVVPPPGQGKSESRINALQAAGNNITYLLRYSNGAICRLQIQEDTDGNEPREQHESSREPEYLPPEPEEQAPEPVKTGRLWAEGKKPNDKTRMWVLHMLLAAPGEPHNANLTEYLRDMNHIKADQSVVDWPLSELPQTWESLQEIIPAMTKWYEQRQKSLV